MNYTIISYLIYLPVIVLLTWWVAQTLYKNGRVFLVDIFNGDTQMADSVNKLLLVGFYLINIGYAVYTMRIVDAIVDPQVMLERLSTKLGLIILLLGLMHFLNLGVLFNLRKRHKSAYYQPQRETKPQL